VKFLAMSVGSTYALKERFSHTVADGSVSFKSRRKELVLDVDEALGTL